MACGGKVIGAVDVRDMKELHSLVYVMCRLLRMRDQVNNSADCRAPELQIFSSQQEWMRWVAKEREGMSFQRRQRLSDMDVIW